MTLILDGRETSFTPGATILQVADRAGTRLPRLCHHPSLAPEGSCRLCLVEDVKTGKLLPACATPAMDGQQIATSSLKVLAAQRFNLELILARHPLDCEACDRDGACELQDLTQRMQIAPSTRQAPSPREKVDLSHPFVGFDPNLCILCHRCIRGCAEIQGRNAIGLYARGADGRIGTGIVQNWGESICESCGTCVELCPSGALFDRPAREHRTGDPVEKVTTICGYCGVGCTLDLNVSGGRVRNVTSNWDRGVNRGALCVKGRFGHEFIHHPDRLDRPLIRSGEGFRESTWDEALDLVASRFAEIKIDAGPDAIGIIASAKATNEENYLIQKFARTVIGTNNVDHCARL